MIGNIEDVDLIGPNEGVWDEDQCSIVAEITPAEYGCRKNRGVEWSLANILHPANE